MPWIRRFAGQLAPQSRRTRVILIRDEIFTKVGGCVLRNFLTSVSAGFGRRLEEEYLLVPRIMGRNVRMPAVVSVLAVLAGGAPAGIGAVKALPAAGALRLPQQEVTFRPLDGT